MRLSEIISGNIAKAAEEQRKAAAQAHYEFVMANRIISPRVIPHASDAEVMFEQMEALIIHAVPGYCGCAECQRYLEIRALLLAPFADRSDMSAPRVLTAKT